MNIKKICDPHNGYLHGYDCGYETNIYPIGRIQIEPSKWVITREPTRLIIGLDWVGLKKITNFSTG